MKNKGNIKKFYHYAFPMQAVLVTCNDKKEKTNVITIAWHTPISKKPPLYGISVAPSRYSHDLIKDSKEFVMNFMPYNLVEKIQYCGSHSGRKVDKISEINLTLVNSMKLKTPYIKEGYAHMECKLYDNITIGDHTFFIGEVVNILSDEKAFIDDLLDNKQIKPPYYIGENVYTTIDENKEKIN